MVTLQIALAQVNATVGDLEKNAQLVVEWTRRAHDQGADLVAFPEMFLTGYPVEDLALRPSFISASQAALSDLTRQLRDEGLGDITVVVGYLDQSADVTYQLGLPRHCPQNAAAVIRDGNVIARYAKHHLPNYGVFDEYRYFVPGNSPCTFEVGGHTVALAICEDLWQYGGPIEWAKEASAELVVVINGSPYERNKDDVRLELCSRRAVEADGSGPGRGLHRRVHRVGFDRLRRRPRQHRACGAHPGDDGDRAQEMAGLQRARPPVGVDSRTLA